MSELIFYDLKQEVAFAPSLSTQVSRKLGRRIVALNYKPGQLIEKEDELAEQYHVSRSVIREAVKTLVSKGLLEVRQGIGTKVRPREYWGLLDDEVLAWHQSAPLNTQFLQHLIEIRLVFEPKAARWAAERAGVQQVAEIQAAFKRMEDEKGSVEEFVVADALFHCSILRAAQNEFLKTIKGVVFSALLNSIRLSNQDPRDNESSIPFHLEVYEAIANKHADLAEELMEKLLADASLRLEKWLKKK